MRSALARELSWRVVTPLVIFLPLLGLLIAWLLRPGLAALNEASRLVSGRDAARLDRLPTDDVPSELLPLVLQINGLMERLAASLDAQRRFLADAAHGLRSPIAAIGLQAELAARSRNAETVETALEDLIRGTRRAARLVQQLLDFARVDADNADEVPRIFDFAAVVRDVLAPYASEAEERDIDLGADMPAAVLVSGRESELRTLVANLVDNALRHAPRQSAVTVSVRRRRARVEIEVTDAGAGIPATERARVFERFYRVEGDRTRGTGLGLAIVKAIVERHRGTVTLADANPGASPPGLAVRVELPAGDDASLDLRSRADLSLA